ncbi:MAG: DNA adenine methylase [Clostridiales Family XIII bacterium]|jgi:adenine-specific DNA-methyltransferase|nr:DNA adenine methylase [Clostridiales Family XIII bacterium]
MNKNTIPKVILSPLNYQGAKHKLFPQIKPLFPNKYNNFIDLFSGGGSVTANLMTDDIASSYLMNDKESHVTSFFKYLSQSDTHQVINEIYKKIREYGLSDSSKNGYSFYGSDSTKGLGTYNKEKFLKLRNDYNGKCIGPFSRQTELKTPILFYLLVCFGFNNQIRFNSKGQYNLPVGKRDFNVRMRTKLMDFSKQIKNKKIRFSSIDFRKVKFNTGDFIYADPPYLITTATYNENGGWTKKDEIDLYAYLDKVHKKGAKFALSNVTYHKGQKNEILIKWSNKYYLHVLNYHYNNSNYQKHRLKTNIKSKQCPKNKTSEVLVTNYESI